MPKKYIYLNNYIWCHGLNDQKDRFTEYLKLSRILNLTPILVNFKLHQSHTRKPNNNLADYIVIPDFVCKEMPENKDEIFYWNLTHGFIPLDTLYLKHKEQIHNYRLDLTFQDKYVQIAADIVRQMNRPLCCLHVRRGDYLDIHQSLHRTTGSAHIRDVLNRHEFKDCYIKTNESNLQMFADLHRDFNIKLFTDFPILKKIHDAGDNYALYAIECCIRNMADIRISTFNTTDAEACWLPNNDKAFFADYLDNNRGYQ